MKTDLDYLQEVQTREESIKVSLPPSRKFQMPEKDYWHIYSLQTLNSEKFIKVVNKILKREYTIKKERESVYVPSSGPVFSSIYSEASGSVPSSFSLDVLNVEQYLRLDRELTFVQEQHRKEQDLLEVLIKQRNEQLDRAEQEIIKLANRIQAIENQKRMDISYALASEDVKTILNLLVKKVTLSIDEVDSNLKENDVINVVCDLCKAHLANLKDKTLIVTSLGLKVAKKLQSLND